MKRTNFLFAKKKRMIRYFSCPQKQYRLRISSIFALLGTSIRSQLPSCRMNSDNFQYFPSHAKLAHPSNNAARELHRQKIRLDIILRRAPMQLSEVSRRIDGRREKKKINQTKGKKFQRRQSNARSDSINVDALHVRGA